MSFSPFTLSIPAEQQYIWKLSSKSACSNGELSLLSSLVRACTQFFCACVRACVRACVCVYLSVYMCVHTHVHMYACARVTLARANTYKHRKRQTDKVSQTDRHTDRKRRTETVSQTDRDTNRKRRTETVIQTDRQRERQKQTDRASQTDAGSTRECFAVVVSLPLLFR